MLFEKKRLKGVHSPLFCKITSRGLNMCLKNTRIHFFSPNKFCFSLGYHMDQRWVYGNLQNVMKRTRIKTDILSLNHFNESCTSYCEEKMAHQVYVRYSTQCSYLAHMIKHFSKIICYDIFIEKEVLRDFKYLVSTFYLFGKKSFCV